MDFTNSLAYRRLRFKNARKNQMLERQNKLKSQGDALTNIRYEDNSLNHETTGLNHTEFSSPLLVSSNGGLFPSEDEPIQIRSLLIKSQFKPLTTKEVDRVRNYYYMTDLKSKNQAEKDKQFIFGETYKIAKKSIGLNGKPLII